MRYSTFATVAMALVAIVVLHAGAAALGEPTREEASPDMNQALIHALEGQVEILKWIGTCVVGGLVAAVAGLFTALQRARAAQSKEQKEALILLAEMVAKQAESNKKLAVALDALRKHCELMSCRDGKK